jgi:uncharacterized membrane protein
MTKPKGLMTIWRANFLTGLAIVLPATLSIALVVWLFGKISNITDALLLFIPQSITHEKEGTGEMYWHWRVIALLLALLLVSVIGRLARNYLGKKIIGMVDELLMRVPLLNKIYGTIKQVNDAFSPSNKSAFKQVVLIEFPRAGHYSVGFVTGEDHQEVRQKTDKKIFSVFVPTTPNPTSGFLVLVPETELTRLDMSVADGIKFIISLGAITPEHAPAKR